MARRSVPRGWPPANTKLLDAIKVTHLSADMRAMKPLVWVLVALPLAAAACGGNDTAAPAHTSSSSLPPAASSTGFVAAAEAICNGMEQDAASLSGGAAPTDEEFKRLLSRWRSGFDRLDALEPPPEREAEVERMLAGYRNMAKAFDAAVLSEDESVLAAFVAAAVYGQRGTRAARAAGLDACALFPEIKQPPADKQPTYEATRQLLPAGAQILGDDDEECSTQGSCTFEYRTAGSLAARARESRAKLLAHDWTDVRSGSSANGTSWLMANRNDYVATFELVGDVAPAHCKGAATSWGCTDSIWVHRVEVPDILTGG
jgi:hypothetical protein